VHTKEATGRKTEEFVLFGGWNGGCVCPKTSRQLGGLPNVFEGLFLLEYSDRDDHLSPSSADVQNTDNRVCSALCVLMV
jgi:hypothetical protein